MNLVVNLIVNLVVNLIVNLLANTLSGKRLDAKSSALLRMEDPFLFLSQPPGNFLCLVQTHDKLKGHFPDKKQPCTRLSDIRDVQTSRGHFCQKEKTALGTPIRR